MAGQKEKVTFEIQKDLTQMLESAAEKYDLPSVDKALRCILDYVATDGDWDEIFDEVRCIRCGSKTGWEE
ncbi:MAG: hypothetical protein CL773_00955 [Chloroflexi bacterium]|nr:hypothetical protein [Chloroflexota bacterium]|tara:strand:- start:135 stop:344 length:210 start_codon:yes stop_codon:yes gene_type:complete